MAVRLTEAEYRRVTGQDPPPGRPAGKAARPKRPLPKVKSLPGPERGTYVTEIRGWHPATINQRDRSRGAKIRLTKRDRKVVGDFLGSEARVPQARSRRRVTVTLLMAKGQRRPDPDSSFKSLLDALQWHGLIARDSPDWCEVVPLQYERTGYVGTRIVLEDL